MEIQDKPNLLFNHYSFINLNYYLPNKRNTILKNNTYNCNFNKINPTCNGKIQPGKIKGILVLQIIQIQKIQIHQ